jgi:hypothetical protein
MGACRAALHQLCLHWRSFGQALLSPNHNLLGALNAILHLDKPGCPYSELNLSARRFPVSHDPDEV